MSNVTEFTRPVSVTEYNTLAGSIPPVGVWVCEECSESLDRFQGDDDRPDGIEWETLVMDSASNYHKYPESSRMSCEWCGTVPRDMIYHTFVFPAED